MREKEEQTYGGSAMLEHDRSNFIAFLKDFPDQPVSVVKQMKNYSIDLDVSGIQNIVFVGMGGSAIAGDILASYARDELKVPVSVNRDYTLPSYVGKETLLIASSYSGNTEETLSAIKYGLRRGAKMVGITSGGELEAICKKRGHPFVNVVEGYPPRQALGHMFFSQLLVLDKLGFIKVKKKDINETIEILNELSARYDPNETQGNNLANHVAQSIYHAVPVVYSGVSHLDPVTVRWQNQFNENSKTMAFSNVFPEMNHNEIIGWEGLPDVMQHFRVIFLRDKEENPRTAQRIKITKSILKKKNILFGEVFSNGESRLARLFSMIYTGDWASYYLAMLNEKDPLTIASIDLLKKKLSELKA